MRKKLSQPVGAFIMESKCKSFLHKPVCRSSASGGLELGWIVVVEISIRVNRYIKKSVELSGLFVN